MISFTHFPLLSNVAHILFLLGSAGLVLQSSDS